MRLLIVALVVAFGVALLIDRLPKLRARLKRLTARRGADLPGLPEVLREAAARDARVASAVTLRDRASELLSRQGAAADPWFLVELDAVIADLAATVAVSRELGLQLAADREVRAGAADEAGLSRRIAAIDVEADATLEGLRSIWGELIEVFGVAAASGRSEAARQRLAELRRRVAAEREARELAPADWA